MMLLYFFCEVLGKESPEKPEGKRSENKILFCTPFGVAKWTMVVGVANSWITWRQSPHGGQGFFATGGLRTQISAILRGPASLTALKTAVRSAQTVPP